VIPVVTGGDEGKALSPFYVGPEFAFIDLDNNGLFEPGDPGDPGDPVYLNINPADGVVSENDVRITSFPPTPSATFEAGTQVEAIDPDHDKALILFGTHHYPAAELRYFDMNGDGSYSLYDPVYLDINPGEVSAGDVRITGYPGDVPLPAYPPASRVSDADPDSGKPTTTLPGMFSFYNYDGNINNGGWALYGKGDEVYLDTQYPFNVVTINDIRLSE
jgi:hypothetical protein